MLVQFLDKPLPVEARARPNKTKVQIEMKGITSSEGRGGTHTRSHPSTPHFEVDDIGPVGPIGDVGAESSTWSYAGILMSTTLNFACISTVARRKLRFVLTKIPASDQVS